MSIRLSRLAMSLLVVAAVVLMSGRCGAVFFPLGPAQDQWGLKYDVELTAAEGDKLNVNFTLADQGRLKPIYSATVVVFSRPDMYGGCSYLVKAPIKLKTTNQGKRAGQVQIPKQYLDGAMIRILTLTVDRRHQSAGAAYYDIPLKRFTSKTPVTAAPQQPPSVAVPSLATPPTSNATR